MSSASPPAPAVLFRASRRMNPDGPTNYRLLAGILTEYVAGRPGAADIAAQLGRAATSAHPPTPTAHRSSSKTRAVADPVDLLDELGLAPEPAAGPRAREIRLGTALFRISAEQHDAVICAVHLGLMQGALTAMRAPVTVDRLEPFVEPDLCVAHLTSVPAEKRRLS